jgi:hypothetical protein
MTFPKPPSPCGLESNKKRELADIQGLTSLTKSSADSDILIGVYSK